MSFRAYREAKQRHPNMLLLFRVGDLFELYAEDAETAARVLGLRLTARTNKRSGEKIFMAGFPHHSLEVHLRSLLQAGHRVAVCDRVEERTAVKLQPTLFDDCDEG